MGRNKLHRCLCKLPCFCWINLTKSYETVANDIFISILQFGAWITMRIAVNPSECTGNCIVIINFLFCFCFEGKYSKLVDNFHLSFHIYSYKYRECNDFWSSFQAKYLIDLFDHNYLGWKQSCHCCFRVGSERMPERGREIWKPHSHMQYVLISMAEICVESMLCAKMIYFTLWIIYWQLSTPA